MLQKFRERNSDVLKRQRCIASACAFCLVNSPLLGQTIYLTDSADTAIKSNLRVFQEEGTGCVTALVSQNRDAGVNWDNLVFHLSSLTPRNLIFSLRPRNLPLDVPFPLVQVTFSRENGIVHPKISTAKCQEAVKESHKKEKKFLSTKKKMLTKRIVSKRFDIKCNNNGAWMDPEEANSESSHTSERLHAGGSSLADELTNEVDQQNVLFLNVVLPKYVEAHTLFSRGQRQPIRREQVTVTPIYSKYDDDLLASVIVDDPVNQVWALIPEDRNAPVQLHIGKDYRVAKGMEQRHGEGMGQRHVSPDTVAGRPVSYATQEDIHFDDHQSEVTPLFEDSDPEVPLDDAPRSNKSSSCDRTSLSPSIDATSLSSAGTTVQGTDSFKSTGRITRPGSPVSGTESSAKGLGRALSDRLKKVVAQSDSYTVNSPTLRKSSSGKSIISSRSTLSGKSVSSGWSLRSGKFSVATDEEVPGMLKSELNRHSSRKYELTSPQKTSPDATPLDALDNSAGAKQAGANQDDGSSCPTQGPPKPPRLFTLQGSEYTHEADARNAEGAKTESEQKGTQEHLSQAQCGQAQSGQAQPMSLPQPQPLPLHSPPLSVLQPVILPQMVELGDEWQEAEKLSAFPRIPLEARFIHARGVSTSSGSASPTSQSATPSSVSSESIAPATGFTTPATESREAATGSTLSATTPATSITIRAIEATPFSSDFATSASGSSTPAVSTPEVSTPRVPTPAPPPFSPASDSPFSASKDGITTESVASPASTYATAQGSAASPASTYATAQGSAASPASTYATAQGSAASPASTTSTNVTEIGSPASSYGTVVSGTTSPASSYATVPNCATSPASSFATVISSASSYATATGEVASASSSGTPSSIHATFSSGASTPLVVSHSAAGSSIATSSASIPAGVAIAVESTTPVARPASRVSESRTPVSEDAVSVPTIVIELSRESSDESSPLSSPVVTFETPSVATRLPGSSLPSTSPASTWNVVAHTHTRRKVPSGMSLSSLTDSAADVSDAADVSSTDSSRGVQEVGGKKQGLGGSKKLVNVVKKIFRKRGHYDVFNAARQHHKKDAESTVTGHLQSELIPDSGSSRKGSYDVYQPKFPRCESPRKKIRVKTLRPKTVRDDHVVVTVDHPTTETVQTPTSSLPSSPVAVASPISSSQFVLDSPMKGEISGAVSAQSLLESPEAVQKRLEAAAKRLEPLEHKSDNGTETDESTEELNMVQGMVNAEKVLTADLIKTNIPFTELPFLQRKATPERLSRTATAEATSAGSAESASAESASGAVECDGDVPPPLPTCPPPPRSEGLASEWANVLFPAQVPTESMGNLTEGTDNSLTVGDVPPPVPTSAVPAAPTRDFEFLPGFFPSNPASGVHRAAPCMAGSTTETSTDDEGNGLYRAILVRAGTTTETESTTEAEVTDSEGASVLSFKVPSSEVETPASQGGFSMGRVRHGALPEYEGSEARRMFLQSMVH